MGFVYFPLFKTDGMISPDDSDLLSMPVCGHHANWVKHTDATVAYAIKLYSLNFSSAKTQ